jgi:hypothetical protein
LGSLAYHVAHAGQPAEAIRIAEAACDVARRASIGMQARAAERLATAARRRPRPPAPDEIWSKPPAPRRRR